MRNLAVAAYAGLLVVCLSGCSEPKTTAIDIPASNPYQQTPEEIAEYNAAGAAKMQNMNPNAKK